MHPQDMASKSLCCSTILFSFKCDIIHKTCVNIDASVHTCSVYTDGRNLSIYIYNIQILY